MPDSPLTFNALLSKLVDKQLKAVEQGLDSAPQYLDATARQELFEQLKTVMEEQDKPKLFDRTSLKNIESFFVKADETQSALKSPDHPAHLVYPVPGAWFEDSNKFMFDEVSFVEIVRFFGGGKTQDEKEITFRTLVAKLIKTQETVRTISQKREFLNKYLELFPPLQEKFPAVFARQMGLAEPPSPSDAILKAMQKLVADISQTCLRLFEELDIPVPEQAQPALDNKQHYKALILTVRHSQELFAELGSDDYSILVEELMKIVHQSHFHPLIFLFQHVKREYLTDWLVNTMRQFDRDGAETFYQAGKAKVYDEFRMLDMSEDTINALKDLEQLNNEEVIKAEEEQLKALSEDDFYELLLKIYTSYKNDALIGQNMPVAVQALSSSGDISWDKQNMVAQTHKKIKELEATGGGAGKAKAKRFNGMFGALKKATKIFSVASKKVDDKKASKMKTQMPKISEEDTTPRPPPGPPPPVIAVKYSGILLEPCFPMPKRDCLNPVKGQKQDYSFNNSDAESGVAPVEQEFMIDLFNVKKDPNLPKLNRTYSKFSNTVTTILRSYDEHVMRIQKKYKAGMNVDSFTEEILYLRIKEDVILTLGNTQMGQSKNVGALPNKQTAYLRLFVKGELSKGLNRYGVPSVLKEFKVDDRAAQFKEISVPTHYKEAPKYQGVLVDALAVVVESLPEQQFDMLNDDNLIGFVGVLQEKARILKEEYKLEFNRSV